MVVLPEWRGKRVLVTGGRHYDKRERVYAELDEFAPRLVIHGAATGADSFADAWARRNGVIVKAFPVSRLAWFVLGNAAGHFRNAKMLRDGLPDFVLAFPGGDGTRDMVRQAQAARVGVIMVGDWSC